MAKDLRSFIAELEAASPAEIARVTNPISPRYEITALLTQLEKSKRFPSKAARLPSWSMCKRAAS